MTTHTVWNLAQADQSRAAALAAKFGMGCDCVLKATQAGLQSWRIRQTEGKVELVSVTESLWALTEEQERAGMLQCGEVLFQLKLALRHFGCLGKVELFPELDQPHLVARISGGCSQLGNSSASTLFDVMMRQNNVTGGSFNVAPSNALLEALRSAVGTERAWLEFARSTASRRELLTLTQAAQLSTHAAPPPATARFMTWPKPLHRFSARLEQVEQRPRSAERSDDGAALAVVKTKTDDKHAWVAAGQTMANVRLQSAALGLPCHSLPQILQNRSARESMRNTIGHKGFLQAIIRFEPPPLSWISTSPTQTATISSAALRR